MKWRITFYLQHFAGGDTCMCQRNVSERQHALYLLGLKINYSNTDDHMFDGVLNAKVRKYMHNSKENHNTQEFCICFGHQYISVE